jgi:DNA-binding CsgD family transcriptional regulator
MEEIEIIIPCKKEKTNEKLLLKHFYKYLNLPGKGMDFVYHIQLDKCLYISSALKDITGQNCEELFNGCILFFKAISHPTDYVAFISEFIEFVKTEKNEGNKNLSNLMKTFTFRVKNKKGLWEQINIHALLIDANKVVGVIQKNKQQENIGQEIYGISPREIEVLLLIANGNSAKIIGDKLNISETTVTTHRKHLKQKFKVKNTAELIKEAAKARII